MRLIIRRKNGLRRSPQNHNTIVSRAPVSPGLSGAAKRRQHLAVGVPMEPRIGNLFSLPNLWRIPLEFSPTRINTNRPEDRWTSFNDNWRQNASALLSRWCDPVMGGSPPGSAGVPPAQILPQLQPSPPPESTGSGALPLLRPGPCGSRRQGGRLQHRRETERQPKGQHAGGTPALPGVSSRW